MKDNFQEIWVQTMDLPGIYPWKHDMIMNQLALKRAPFFSQKSESYGPNLRRLSKDGGL